MSAGENDPSILESIRQDVRQVQREQGRQPVGTLRPETEQALQERRIQAAVQRVATRAPTASTITQRKETGEITIEPAKPVQQEPDVTTLEGDGQKTVILDRGGDPTLRQKLRREVSPGLGPIATEENVEQLRRGEERLIERGGLPAALFAGGETISRFGAGISGGVQDILPLEDVGPAISVPGFEAEDPVGKQFERGVGAVVGGIPILAGQIPQALAGAPTLVEQAEEEGVGEVGGRFGEQLQVGATQTATQFARNPVEAGVLIGAAAGARPAVRAARSPRAAARGATGRVAEIAPERAVELGRGLETRVRGLETRVRGGERTVMARELEIPEQPTTEFRVRQPRLEITEEGRIRVPPEESIVPPELLREIERGAEFEIRAAEEQPLLEVTKTGRGPQIQTTVEAFEGGRPTLEQLRLGREPRSLVEIRMAIRRAMERQEAGRGATERQFQETLTEEPGFDVLVERTGTRQVPRPDLVTREGFEVSEVPSLVGERGISVRTGQTGLSQEVARIREPGLFGRIRGRGREIEVLEPEFVKEVQRGLGIERKGGAETLGQLQLLGRETGRQRTIEPVEGFEFVERQPTRFEVEGGELPGARSGADGLVPVFPSFEFGVERGPTANLFDFQRTIEPDIQELPEDVEAEDFREDLVEAQQERQRQIAAATQIEVPRIEPLLESEEIQRQEVGERTEELVAPREDVVPLEDTLIGEDVTTDLTTDITTTTDIVPEPDIPPPIVPTPDIPGPRVPPPPGGLLGAAGRGQGELFGFLFGRVFENPIELDILDDDEEGEGIDLV